MTFERIVREGLRSRRQSKRTEAADRIHSGAPWREVAFIGKGMGSKGGSIYYLVLECGHLAIRSCTEPQPHRIFRRKPGAPKRCRCLSCKLGLPSADPQAWTDSLIRSGKVP